MSGVLGFLRRWPLESGCSVLPRRLLSRVPVVVLLLLGLLGCNRTGAANGERVGEQRTSEGQRPRGADGADEPKDPVRSMEKFMETNSGYEVAVLAGGCFWGMEEILRSVDGVIDTEVGYAGGTTSAPTYETVKRGTTGHAEAVRIAFDPKRLAFAELLERWFFRMHDPTTQNRQGNDIGTQYRSAIFAMNEAQVRVARQVIEQVEASGVWGAPIVTEVTQGAEFTPAEGYHQDYLQVHPGGYTCHFLREF